MSVAWAPRARMAVNASWPGVSRNVTLPCAGHHLVGADVLRDAAELLLGHLGLADGVEQRRLAVVDVAHDRDDRRPQRQLGWIDSSSSMTSPSTERISRSKWNLSATSLASVGIEQVVDHLHHAELDEGLDDLARLAAHLLGQLGDRDRLAARGRSRA